MADSEEVKWMKSEDKFCHRCGRLTRHDVGCRWRDGKQVLVNECVACHEVTEGTTPMDEADKWHAGVYYGGCLQ